MYNIDKTNKTDITLILWPNGRKFESIFNVNIDLSTIKDLKRLKEHIIYACEDKKIIISYENFRLFTQKGMELDDSDIDGLQNNQLFFYSDDGSPFTQENQLNLYKYVKSIKSGGFGQVYLAQNQITKEFYAVKKIGTERFSVDELYNISREQVYMESLNHRNIIHFRTSFNFDNNFYLVMDYAKGGELTNYVEQCGPLKEEEAKRIFKQIYKGVVHMHKMKTVHRDLKPNNILFLDEKRENVVIIDFGICGFSSGKDKEIIKAGTIDYVPPEIASGKAYESSFKVDVWAMGVILYYMLYKILPFNGKTKADVLKNILSKEPNYEYKGINKQLSTECLLLIRKMLDKNQQFRCDLDDEIFDLWFEPNENNKKLMMENEKVKNSLKNASLFSTTRVRKGVIKSTRSYKPVNNNVNNVGNVNTYNPGNASKVTHARSPNPKNISSQPEPAMPYRKSVLSPTNIRAKNGNSTNNNNNNIYNIKSVKGKYNK